MEIWKRRPKIKTSIALPQCAVALYKKFKNAIVTEFQDHLPQVTAEFPRRDTTRHYNNTWDEFKIVQVFWPVSVYNELHAVAAAVRISVSLLVYRILLCMAADAGRKKPRIFSNYVMIVRSWSDKALHIEEKITFDKQHTDSNSQDPPIAA
jgi:hypothetical protein